MRAFPEKTRPLPIFMVGSILAVAAISNTANAQTEDDAPTSLGPSSDSALQTDAGDVDATLEGPAEPTSPEAGSKPAGVVTSSTDGDLEESNDPSATASKPSPDLENILRQHPALAMDLIMRFGSEELKSDVGLTTKRRFVRIDRSEISGVNAAYADILCSRLWGPAPSGHRYIFKLARRRGRRTYACIPLRVPSVDSVEIPKKHLSFDFNVGEAGFETGFPKTAFLGSALKITVYPLPFNLGFGLTAIRGLLIFSHQETDLLPFTLLYTLPINLSKSRPLMSFDLFATGSYLNFDSIPAKGDRREISRRYSPMVTFGLNMTMPVIGKSSSRESYYFLRFATGYSVGKKTIRKEYLGEGFFFQMSAVFGIRKYKSSAECTGVTVEEGGTISRVEKCVLE